MLIERTTVPGVMVITPDIYEDERGKVKETLNKFMNFEAKQVNQAINNKGTIRGLHNQPDTPKLVWVIKGKIWDVAYDAHTGLSVGVELSAENNKQIYLPGHIFHGFQALEDDTIVCYLLGDYYNQRTELGLNPNLVNWPLKEQILSEKDKHAREYLVQRSV